jgi:hypothetical protein
MKYYIMQIGDLEYGFPSGIIGYCETKRIANKIIKDLQTQRGGVDVQWYILNNQIDNAKLIDQKVDINECWSRLKNERDKFIRWFYDI